MHLPYVFKAYLTHLYYSLSSIILKTSLYELLRLSLIVAALIAATKIA